jgi:transcriptional regulator with XRE-family HTH domain
MIKVVILKKKEVRMRDLRIWLFTNRITVTDFAKRLDISRAYLGMILSGSKIPSKKVLRGIEKETNGEFRMIKA